MATLDLEPGTGADDGNTFNEATFDATAVRVLAGQLSTTRDYDTWVRFPGASGLSGATINTCTFTVMPDTPSGTAPDTTLEFALGSDAPAAPTTAAEHVTLQGNVTSPAVDWNVLMTNNVQIDSPDLSVPLKELVDAQDPSVIMLLHDEDVSGENNFSRYGSFEATDSADIPHLFVDFTAAAGGIVVLRRRHDGY